MVLAFAGMTGPQSERIVLPFGLSGSRTTAARRRCIISRFCCSAGGLPLPVVPPLGYFGLPVLTGTIPRPRPSYRSPSRRISVTSVFVAGILGHVYRAGTVLCTGYAGANKTVQRAGASRFALGQI